MTFRHVRTDDLHNPTDHSRTRLLERLLVRHAGDGVDVLELRRQMGKSGYVPTEHRWEHDGTGEELTDADGEVLLIGGVPPADLAAELVDTARQHVEETGERKNYRVVGLRNVEDDDGDDLQQELFRFLLPATMFGAVPDAGSGTESREHHDALMAANSQLQRQNDLLFRMLMEVIRQYPVVLGKSTELMEQLGDQLGGGRKHDLEQILAILSFESQRDQQWMAHDRAKQRAGHKADLLGRSMEVAGPDVMVLLRKVMEMVMTAGAAPQAAAANDGDGYAPGTKTPPSAGPSHEATHTPPPPPQPDTRSPYAKRLDDALSAVSGTGLAQAKAVLDKDEWSLIEAARAVETDDEFVAVFTKLQQAWTADGEKATKARMTKLIDAMGMKAAMTIGALIKEVQGR